MRKPEKETLIQYLLIAAIVLVSGAAFVLLYEKVVPYLGTILSFVGVLLSPFIIAWLAAVITRPLNQFLIRKLHFPPTLAVLLMMLVVFTFIALLIMLVISVVANVVSNLTQYAHELNLTLDDAGAFIAQLYDKLNLDYSQVKVYLDQISDQFVDWASQGVGFLVNVAKGTPGAIVLIFVAFVAVFYWCRDELKVRNAICGILPRKHRNNAERTYDNISNVIGQYVRAQLILISISFLICTVGFAIIGVGSPLAMGLFTAVMDIIPVLGPGTLIVPWAIWSFISGEIGFGIGLLIIYALTSIARYILEPKIVGDRVGLHPLAALAAIFIGMKMFGLAGLILGPIILAVIVAAYRGRRQRIILDPNGDGTPLKNDKTSFIKDKLKPKRAKNKDHPEAEPPDDNPKITIS